MEYLKIIVPIAFIILVIIVALNRNKIRAKGFGMNFNAEDTTRKNKARVKGNRNKIVQGDGSNKKTAVDNDAVVRGDDNEISLN
ncbi:hypothetical protein [Mucilaginibacter sp. dw_454]|uniref:hypothetical protein n=1 Tax=Mucilaginibacter sp. dw_454 TaxID=2720079 RepID=UPI001BD3AD84|nr:hypothetical protein [Mucilaginibacter sp. dw_454]